MNKISRTIRTKRVYYHYQDLEEYQRGMWRIVRGEERKACILRAAKLMMETAAFYSQMLRALTEWPKSCEHNLTCDGMNKIAWLGHAGCCIGAASPEEATRAAWYRLNDSQMDAANAAAAAVLALYEAGPQLEMRLE